MPISLEDSRLSVAQAKLTQSTRLLQSLARAWKFAGYGLQVILPRLPRFTRASGKPLLDERFYGLRVRMFPSVPASKAFVHDLEQLTSQIPEASAFHAFHWIRPLLDYPERLARLRLICVHDKGQLIGVLPLEQFWYGAFTISGEMMSDYLDPPVHPDYTEQFWNAALQAIAQYRQGESLSLELPNLSCESPDRKVLHACASANGFQFHEEAFDISARIHLRDSWEDQLATLKSHDRKEIRRKLKRADEQGGARLRIVESPEQIDEAMAHTLELMRLGGGGKGRKAKWVYADHFRQCAAPLTREGRLRVYQLLLSGQVASSLIAMPQKTREILWCGAYDPHFASMSPGITLFAMVMQDAINRKLTILDLLRGQHDYKYKLGAVDHPVYRIMLTR